jgi:uncharacterized membrane protein YdjX (TVP38/TMEM64 family)
MTKHVKPLILAGTLLALLTAVALSPVTEWLGLGVRWIQTHPGAAEIAFVGAYIVAAVLVVPGSILTLAAGFVFGLPVGIVLVSAGSVLGAAAAFLVGRFFARDWVAQRVARLPRFRALDSATRHEGFVIVLLARLSPLFPFNLLNYGLGLTGVKFRDYFLATWIGMLPATFMYVYIGTLAKDLTQITAGNVERGPGQLALLIFGLVATVVLTVLITRRASRALAAHLAAEARDDV